MSEPEPQPQPVVPLDAAAPPPVGTAPEPPPAPPPGSPYPETDGVVWVPVHSGTEVTAEARRWTTIGWVTAAVIGLVAIVLILRQDGLGAVVLGIGGAVAAGVLLVTSGIGLVLGEALRAERVPPPQTERFAASALSLSPELLKTLREGLSGLTAGRSLVFAGVFLLAVAAIGGGVSAAAADGEDGADGTDPTPSPSVSVTAEPTPPAEG